jgi:intracellular sulfur oxidation DsrE/DsrF family protein
LRDAETARTRELHFKDDTDMQIATSADADFWQTPVLRSAGELHPLPDSVYQPDTSADYAVVFALSSGAKDPEKINPGLARVARTVNLYASAGVPTAQLTFVAVISGGATAIVLDDEHYRQQFGCANPNLPVIGELKRNGVEVTVCGQSIAEHEYGYDWVSGEVTTALSALTTVTMLQRQGYAVMPL